MMIPINTLIDAALSGLVLAGAAYFGVAAVLLGLRGWREGAEPHCRGCGYELGVEPAYEKDSLGGDGEPRCPECGTVLVGPHRVVRGRRRSSRRMVAAGVVILALGGLWWGAAQALRGMTPASKPVWWLSQELEHRDVDHTEFMLAVDELQTRATAGLISVNAANTLTTSLLGRQGDRSRSWSAELADLFIQVYQTGSRPDEAILTYLDQVIPSAEDFNITVKPDMEHGDHTLHYRYETLRGLRGRESDRAAFAISVNPTLILGENAGELAGEVWETGRVVWFSHTAQADRPSISQQYSVTFVRPGELNTRMSERTDLPPGEHTVEFETTVHHYDVVDSSGTGSSTSSGPQPMSGHMSNQVQTPPRSTTRHTQRQWFVKHPPGIHITRAVSDPELAAAYAQRMRPMEVALSLRPETGHVWGLVSFGGAWCNNEIALAHKIFVRLGASEHALSLNQVGRMPCDTPVDQAGLVAMSQREWQRFGSIGSRIRSDTLTPVSHAQLVLRPDHGLATRSIDETEYLGNELNLGWIPITWEFHLETGPVQASELTPHELAAFVIDIREQIPDQDVVYEAAGRR